MSNLSDLEDTQTQEILEDSAIDAEDGLNEEVATEETLEEPTPPPQEPKKGKGDRISQLTYRLREAERMANQLKSEVFALKAKQSQEELARLTQEAEVLKAKRRQAIDDGNGELFEQTEAQLEKLRPVIPDKNQGFNAVDYFANKNPWFKTNEVMEKYAKGLDAELQQDPDWSAAPIKLRLDEVARRTLEKFPKTQQRKTSGTEGTGSGGSDFRSSAPVSYSKKDDQIMQLAMPKATLEERKKAYMDILKAS